jgi:DNA-binding LytR/AlgR family response regulator
MMPRIILPEHPQIAYLQADVNYTVFHLSDGSKVISSRTLKKYASVYEQFDFLRISRSYLLNPSFIASVTPKDVLFLRETARLWFLEILHKNLPNVNF